MCKMIGQSTSKTRNASTHRKDCPNNCYNTSTAGARGRALLELSVVASAQAILNPLLSPLLPRPDEKSNNWASKLFFRSLWVTSQRGSSGSLYTGYGNDN